VEKMIAYYSSSCYWFSFSATVDYLNQDQNYYSSSYSWWFFLVAEVYSVALEWQKYNTSMTKRKPSLKSYDLRGGFFLFFKIYIECILKMR